MCLAVLSEATDSSEQESRCQVPEMPSPSAACSPFFSWGPIQNASKGFSPKPDSPKVAYHARVIRALAGEDRVLQRRGLRTETTLTQTPLRTLSCQSYRCYRNHVYHSCQSCSYTRITIQLREDRVYFCSVSRHGQPMLHAQGLSHTGRSMLGFCLECLA